MRWLYALPLLFVLVHLSAAVRAQDGTLDLSFGDDGTVTAGVGATQFHTPEGVAVQPDGKFVVAGWALGTFSSARPALARFDREGALDPSFGVGGRVLIEEVGGARARAIAVKPDGRLIVAGQARIGEYSGLALYQFRPDGSLDPAFGVNGRVVTSIGELSSSAHAVALQPDGKIVAAGRSDLLSGFGSAIAIARYEADGTLDTSFGDGGIVVKRIGADTSARYDNVFDIAIDSMGRVVVAGSHEAPDDRLSFALLRFGPDGELDTSFGGDGIVTTSFGATDAKAFALALLSDGRIVAAGYAGSLSTSGFASARYLATGALDSSFGSGGTVVTPLSPGRDVAEALLVQPDGRFVLAGNTEAGGVPSPGLVRYLPDGSLDTSFGEGGVVLAPETEGSTLVMSAAVLLEDGQLATVGAMTNPNDFALSLHEADGTLDRSFGEEGIATVGDFVPGADAFRDLALHSDGRFVVLGGAESSSHANASLIRFTEDGAPDPSFGAGGAVTFPYGPPTRNYAIWGPRSLATAGDEIIIAGFVPETVELEDDNPPMDFLLARFENDGTLDPDFEGGLFTTDLGADDRANFVLVQNDGKVIAGGATGGFPSNGSGGVDLALVRYGVEGRLDPTFGDGGIALLDEALYEVITTAALLPDGRILVAGYRTDDGVSHEAFVARFLPNGILDETFGTAGFSAITPPADYPLLFPIDVALLPSGQSFVASTALADSGGRTFYVFSLNSDGSFAWARQEDALEATSVAVDAQGRLVVAGKGIGVAVTARYTPDGTPDPAYGDGGIVVTDVNLVGGPIKAIAHPLGRVIAATTVQTGSHPDIGLWALRNGIEVNAEPPQAGDSVLPRLTVWPNPVRTFATAAITLSESDAVKVEVLDVLGRRVAVLHDGPLAAGPHDLTLDTDRLPSGVYLVRIVVGEQKVTRKIFVTK